MKRIISLTLASVMLFTSFASATTGINNVQKRTKEQILSLYYWLGLNETVPITYDITPSGNAQSGKLSDESLQNALDGLNFIRYIAGLNYDVELDSSYTQKAQDASFIMELNGTMTHYPEKPAGVSESLYQSGYSGASSSNISAGRSSLINDLFYGWMADDSGSNLTSLGHRRWILNPQMKKTGFGITLSTDTKYKSYSAMYSFDNWTASTNVSGVIWPAQVMPVMYFKSTYPWSYSYGDTVNGDVKVTLTRLSDNKKWSFSNTSADGYFNVNNSNYGQKGCIIFRPDDISYSAGDKFNVSITGAVTANYDVEFMDFTNSISGASYWAHSELWKAKSENYPVDLFPDTFKNNMTRAEFCYMLGKFMNLNINNVNLGENKFTDLGSNPADQPNRNDYIVYLSNLGIINGTSDTTFAPNNEITREEMSVLMYRYYRLTNDLPYLYGATLKYNDYSSISSWAMNALSFMNQEGIIEGTSETNISPQGKTTIEQAALICYRFFSKIVS